MKQSELIILLIGYTEQLKNQAKAHQQIPTKTLLQIPANDGWNALECYAHMNLFGKLYLKFAEASILKAPARVGDPKHRSGIIGKWSYQSMEPQAVGVRKPMKTLKVMNPRGKSLDKLTIEQFIKQQEGFLTLLERAKQVDIDRVKCRTSIKFLKFKLSDALHFNTNHNRRHMLQVQRLLSNS